MEDFKNQRVFKPFNPSDYIDAMDEIPADEVYDREYVLYAHIHFPFKCTLVHSGLGEAGGDSL